MLAVMLLDHLGAARGFQDRPLPDFAAQIDDIGLKLLLEIERMKFQLFDVEEHCENLRGNAPNQPAEARQGA